MPADTQGIEVMQTGFSRTLGAPIAEDILTTSKNYIGNQLFETGIGFDRVAGGELPVIGQTAPQFQIPGAKALMLGQNLPETLDGNHQDTFVVMFLFVGLGCFFGLG